MTDSICCKFQYFFLKLSRISLKNRFQSSCSSFTDSIGFLISFFDKAEILKQSLDQLFCELASQKLIHVGIALNTVLFSGKNAPKLHGNDAATFLAGILQDRIDLCGEKHDVVALNPGKIAPYKFYEGL